MPTASFDASRLGTMEPSFVLPGGIERHRIEQQHFLAVDPRVELRLRLALAVSRWKNSRPFLKNGASVLSRSK